MTKYTYSLVFLTLAIFLTSITSAFSQETVDSLAVQKGEQIYKANCTSCHMMTDKALIGPGLKGVTDRRNKAWLKKWINSSSDFIASGDADAIALYEEYNKVAMPSYYFEDADFEALFAYLKNPPIVEEVVTADLVLSEEEGIKTSTILMIIALFLLLLVYLCLLYTSPSPRDRTRSRMPSSA